MFPKRCFTEPQPHKMLPKEQRFFGQQAKRPPRPPLLAEFIPQPLQALGSLPARNQRQRYLQTLASVSPSLISILPPAHFLELPLGHRERTSSPGEDLQASLTSRHGPGAEYVHLISQEETGPERKPSLSRVTQHVKGSGRT